MPTPPALPFDIRSLPSTRVAYMRHVGPYGSPGIAALRERFDAWCAARGLAGPTRRRYGIAQDNPNITPPDRVRYDLCIEVDDTFQPSGDVGVQTLPGGRFACIPFTGTAAEIKAAWVRFLGHTLPQHGFEPDLCPAVEIYRPESVEDPGAGAVSCLLCMPVRSIP